MGARSSTAPEVRSSSDVYALLWAEIEKEQKRRDRFERGVQLAQVHGHGDAWFAKEDREEFAASMARIDVLVAAAETINRLDPIRARAIREVA